MNFLHPMRINRYFVILFAAFSFATILTSCASEQPVTTQDGLKISKIRIRDNGVTSKHRPNMSVICKGFILNRKQVTDFFVYSSHAKETRSYSNYNILPCYTKGTMLINNKPYEWIIRSGGIGEFFNANHHFVKICGKTCCGKISGMC